MSRPDMLDIDLLNVLPEASDILAPAATVTVYTHGLACEGKLSHPSVWWTDYGLTAYYTRHAGRSPKPPSMWTDKPLVGMSLLDALRAGWLLESCLVLDGQPIWDSQPLRPARDDILAYIRHWPGANASRYKAARDQVRASLRAACQRVQAVLQETEHDQA